MSERLLTASEVAELLNVPESWVREATREQRLPYIALGRYRRYARAQIEAWLEQQQAGPTCPDPTCFPAPRELDMSTHASPGTRSGERSGATEASAAPSGGSATATPAAAACSKRSARNPPGTASSPNGSCAAGSSTSNATATENPHKITFASFAEQWLEEYLPGRNLKLTTTDGYRQTLRNHLLPHFGHTSLEELERRPELIDRYITLKTRQGLVAEDGHQPPRAAAD